MVADYAEARLGVGVGALLPQLIAHCCLAAALTAYEQWLADPGADLPELLDRALRALDGSWAGA